MITEKKLAAHQAEFHPLFLPDLDQDNTFFLDLTSGNPDLENLDYSHTHSLGAYVFNNLREKNLLYAYGGYMEDREVYRRSPLFVGQAEEARSIHLGTDIWAPAGTPVYLPLNGVVHSFQDNSRYGDYGPTIIMEHDLDGHAFYTLYGHLDQESLTKMKEGMMMHQGSMLCSLGDAPDNGDWPPHLHFQVIADMQGMKGDFPGVAFAKDKEHYRKICPDPAAFFKKLQRTVNII